MRTKQFTALLLRFVLSAVLLAAAIGKVLVPEKFYIFLRKVDPPAALYDPSFFVLVYFEFFLGMLCLLGLGLRGTLRAISVMFLVFSIVLGIALVQNLSGSCGCFGNLFLDEIGVLSLLRNLVLAVGAFYASTEKVQVFTLSSLIDRWFVKSRSSFP